MAGLGYIVGSLLSYGFQFVHHGALEPWQILFLTVGVVNFVFGVITLLFLPEGPTSAWFLNEEEKLLVVEHIRGNHTGLENKKFKMEQIRELFFKDKHTWPILFLTGCSQISTGSLGLFSVTVLDTFGFKSKNSALLQLPIGAFVILVIAGTTQVISKTGKWTYVTLLMHVPSIVGCIILVVAPLSLKVGNLLAIYLVYSGSCVITNFYLWNTFNTAGSTKRVFRNALMLIFCNVATTVAPQTFRAHDAPDYHPPKITLLVTQCISVPLVCYVGWISKKENEKRDAAGVKELPDNFEFMDMTDMENPNFRYTW